MERLNACGALRERVLDRHIMPGARWFDGALINYAEQSLWRALRPEWASRAAVVCESESRSRIELTWGELGAEVAASAATFRSLGVRQGDRVAAYLPNVPESIIAMLAATSLGAVWSSAAPDMGAVGVLDRFRQIKPKVLVAVDGYRHGGKDFDRRDVLGDIVSGLPELETLILVSQLDDGASFEAPCSVSTLSFHDAVAKQAPLEFTPVPFAHPLWVVYSSGTSGKPKPIVHGHGGFLLEVLIAEHPNREPLSAQLIIAYYVAERQSDALDAYRRLKTALSEDLGIHPGPTVRDLHERILRQEVLDVRRAAVTAAASTLGRRATATGRPAVARLGALSGQVYPLIGAATRFGRLADNDVVLDDAEFSRHHAVVSDTGAGFVITDLRSANGVYVQDRRTRGSVALADRDRVRICQHEFVFEINPETDGSGG